MKIDVLLKYLLYYIIKIELTIYPYNIIYIMDQLYSVIFVVKSQIRLSYIF